MRLRAITPKLEAALEDTPVVFVQGPRQSGKTTLAQMLQQPGSRLEPYTYFTFDDAAVGAGAETDPDGFVDRLPLRVILDEVQRVPGIFRAIKRSVDRRREPGRFLLTGSANALVLPKVAESLAGRMEVLTLWPFSQGEAEGRAEGFVDACFASDFRPGNPPGADWPSLSERIARGGYPEVQSRTSERRAAWFGSYVTTVLEREVRDISDVHGLREMPKLLRLAAARAGSLLNFSDLARDAALAQTTLKRHWALFEATFLVTALPAWSASLGQRLVKSPKVLFGDTGLLCWLLGLEPERLQSDPLLTGSVLEAFVGAELMKQITWSKTAPGLFHFRTHAQREVDFVLEDRSGRLVGIEVKKTASPRASDFEGLRHLKELVGKRFQRGILLYPGAQTVGFGPELEAVPVSALWHASA